MNSPNVEDRTDESRFVIEIDGLEAELVYRLADGRLRLVHTGVPEELGGRGIGGRLVRAALDRAAAEGLTVVPSCEFARAWIDKHPDEAARVTIA
ncbi:MAG: N-acetyltransferase [Acidimicrobiales bacterium]|nr:N-acetyltransferase [Acidimicrobiales bacterium]